MQVGVPFVLVNQRCANGFVDGLCCGVSAARRSDVALEIVQRGRSEGAALPVGAEKPFSWPATGARELLVRAKCARVVDAWSAWSAPLNVSLVGETSLTLALLDDGLALTLTVRVALIDVKCRCVVFNAGQRVVNATRCALLVEAPCGPRRNALVLALPPAANVALSLVAPFLFVALAAADGRTRQSSAEPIVIGAASSSSIAKSDAGSVDGDDDCELNGDVVPLVLHRRDDDDVVVLGAALRAVGATTTVQLGVWQRAAPLAVANRAAVDVRVRWSPRALPSPHSSLGSVRRDVCVHCAHAARASGVSTRQRRGEGGRRRAVAAPLSVPLVRARRCARRRRGARLSSGRTRWARVRSTPF